MPQRKTYFNPQWAVQYKDVIVPHSSDRTIAICKICNKTGDKVIQLSNMGERAVKSHVSGKDHLNALRIKEANYGIGIFAASSRSTVHYTPVSPPSQSTFLPFAE